MVGPSQEVELAVRRRGVSSLLLPFQRGGELVLRLHLSSPKEVLARAAGRHPKHSGSSDLGQRWAERHVEVQGCMHGDPPSQHPTTSSGCYLTGVTVPAKATFPG